jgi:uncharacterized protein DUF3891
MIVRADAGRLLLVTQPDHAAFSADLLSLFRLPQLVENPRRASLLRAARLHDNGWREVDAAPRVNPVTGLPHDVFDLPDRLRIEIWDRSSARYERSDPYTALLTTQHALSLYRANAGKPGWRDLLPTLDERRAELLAVCELTADDLAADYRFLELADQLSLAVCSGSGELVQGADLEGRLHDDELVLSPFPLAGATTFQVPCRRVERRRYLGDADLAGALAAERWDSFPVRVVPA